MPVLTTTTLTLSVGAPGSPQGDPVAQTTASAPAAGGESREGNPTSAKQNTWTRLFQSLLNDNQTQGSSTPASGSTTPAQGGATPARRGSVRTKDSLKKDSAGGDAAPTAAVPQAPSWLPPVLQAPIQVVPVSPAPPGPASGLRTPAQSVSTLQSPVEAIPVLQPQTASLAESAVLVSQPASAGMGPAANAEAAAAEATTALPAQTGSFGAWVGKSQLQAQPSSAAEAPVPIAGHDPMARLAGYTDRTQQNMPALPAASQTTAAAELVSIGANAVSPEPNAMSEPAGGAPAAQVASSSPAPAQAAVAASIASLVVGSASAAAPAASMTAAVTPSRGPAQVAGGAPVTAQDAETELAAGAVQPGLVARLAQVGTTPSATVDIGVSAALTSTQQVRASSRLSSASAPGSDPASSSVSPVATATPEDHAPQRAAVEPSNMPDFVGSVSFDNQAGAASVPSPAGIHPAPASAAQAGHAGAASAEKAKSDAQSAASSKTATSDNTAVPAGQSTQPAAPLAANPAASTVPGPSQNDRIAVIRQVANQVSGLNPVQSGASSVTVQLHPAQWGEVKVSLTMLPAQASANTDGKSAVTATLVASDPSVGNILRSHLPDLSRALNGAGFSVGKVEVVVQATTAASAGQGGSAFHQGQNPSSNGGFLPNQQGLAAHTGGGGGHQGSQFGTSFGQQQGGGGNNGAPSQSTFAGQSEVESVAPAPAQLPVQKGRVDYRI